MSEMDWTYLNDGLDIATVDRGVTAGMVKSLFLCECLTREHRAPVVHAAAA